MLHLPRFRAAHPPQVFFFGGEDLAPPRTQNDERSGESDNQAAAAAAVGGGGGMWGAGRGRPEDETSYVQGLESEVGVGVGVSGVRGLVSSVARGLALWLEV